MINLLSALNNVRETIGMDSNYFYPVLVTILLAVIPILKSIISFWNNSRKNKLLDLHRTEESDFFYVNIILISIVFTSIGYCIAIIINTFVMAMFPYCIEVLLKIILSICCFIISFLLFKLFIKGTYVRKRVLGEKRWKWLLYCPIVLLNLSLYSEYVIPQCYVFGIIYNILFSICQIIGMTRFCGRYVIYRYSSVEIYTANGDKIECLDVSQILRRHQILMIKKPECEIYIRYEDITRVIYKGEELIIMNTLFQKCFHTKPMAVSLNI